MNRYWGTYNVWNGPEEIVPTTAFNFYAQDEPAAQSELERQIKQALRGKTGHITIMINEEKEPMEGQNAG